MNSFLQIVSILTKKKKKKKTSKSPKRSLYSSGFQYRWKRKQKTHKKPPRVHNRWWLLRQNSKLKKAAWGGVGERCI